MTILVTGATGGFGKALLPLLRSTYAEPVIGVGRAIFTGSDYIQCDISNEAAVLSLIRSIRPRLIFHLVGSFTGQFEADFQVNVLSARYLFDAILSENLLTRVVIIGSAAEYGIVQSVNNPISEALPCNPVSIYGLTKFFQTQLALFYSRAKNLDIVVARVFNLALPGLSARLFYGRAEELIRSYKRGDISKLEFGNLDSQRDYVELEQAKGQLIAIASGGVAGEIYNVGSGIPKSMRVILKDMLVHEGILEWPVLELNSEIVGNKGFDVSVVYADIEKTTKLLDN